MNRELKLFFTAVSFYSRLPVPSSVHQRGGGLLPGSIRYLPVVGWLMGLVASAVYLAAAYLFGDSIALIASMAATILLTGAFHEDGFADVCDGFGGGWTKEKILEIMKDSRLGTYGVTGLVFILALKFAALQQLLVHPINPLTLCCTFVIAHSLSRFAAVVMVFTYPYARLTESKAGTAVERGKRVNLIIAAIATFLPLLILVLLTAQPSVLLVIIPAALICYGFGNYYKKWIGGYTGDCLGAVQQVTEVLIYLSFVLLWKYI